MISREDRLRSDDHAIRETLRAEGKAEGKAEGEAIGEAKQLREVIHKLMDKGFDSGVIADMLDLPLSEVAGMSGASKN